MQLLSYLEAKVVMFSQTKSVSFSMTYIPIRNSE